MKIIGATVGTTTPKANWAQENPKRADYIRNKPEVMDGVSCTHQWDGTVLTVKSASGESSADLKGEQGIQGEKGDPFTIAKVYESVEQMNADYANPDVSIGSFVMIVSNTNDEDNAKLYCKGESEYVYIVDMSGMQGIQGPQGIQGIQGNKGDSGKDGVSMSHTWDGTILTVTSEAGTSSADLQGATFTPSVSTDGVLAWGNNKGLANPTPVNIRGPKGEDGKSVFYSGTNPLNSIEEDTKTFWAGKGGGYWWISGAGNLKEQPSNHGFLLNMCYGTGECFQVFFSSSTGAISVRSGGAGTSNSDGWYRVDAANSKMWREVAFADMLSTVAETTT